MAKFYVNELYDKQSLDPILSRRHVIGLFKQCEATGRGNFCGYYGAEFYVDTELYAYYIADCDGLYRPEARVSDVVVCPLPIKCDEVQIGSHMWTKVIEADSLEEAITLFGAAVWRNWCSPFDEVGMIPVSPCPLCGKLPSVFHEGGPGIDGLMSHFECRDCKIGVAALNKNSIEMGRLWNKYIENGLKERKNGKRNS